VVRDNGSLLRVITTRRLTAGIVNATIGAGIFVLPATAAGELGPAAPLAYLACGGLMALVVLCLASAGSRVSVTGGLTAYADVAFGPFAGFLAGCLYCLSALFACASVASALADSLGSLWPPLTISAVRAALLAAVFAGLAIVNVRGAAPGARLVEAITVAKLLPIAVLIGAGVWFIQPAQLAITAAPPAAAVGRTAIQLIFAFIGVEVALVPGGEIENPARSVPRAIFAALAITTTIYLALQVVAQGVLGASLAAHAAAPFAEVMARIAGPRGRALVIAGAAVSMLGYLAGDLLGSPRTLYALGRERLLPSVLGGVHPRFHTPHVAVLVYTAIATALAVSSTFSRLAVVSNVAILSLYLVCVAAAHELRRRGVRTSQPPFTRGSAGCSFRQPSASWRRKARSSRRHRPPTRYAGYVDELQDGKIAEKAGRKFLPLLLPAILQSCNSRF
jgi:basic amino acid/polyamine antiporter, APA family